MIAAAVLALARESIATAQKLLPFENIFRAQIKTPELSMCTPHRSSFIVVRGLCADARKMNHLDTMESKRFNDFAFLIRLGKLVNL